MKQVHCEDTKAVCEGYVFPGNLNNNNMQFGGRTLSILDANAGISVVKYLPGVSFVTASYDRVHFIKPISEQSIYKCVSYVTGASPKAVEVFTKFVTQDKKTGAQQVAFTAFCSLVITERIDEVPEIVPDSAESKYLCSGYDGRLTERLREFKQNKEFLNHIDND
ncbi:acyl-CoA thioester hydrolase [Lentilactobacillus sp. SPB1-3]|uniref:Acyl-CoA thioester hydrolase n=1 Tax=Lentilactobacillus terminaliae TaxID=3003483 RepID=A0ACD5DFL3_9LACO|nr:acyl-CoA thioester hydrolase [Lentilactobacillus sp. SPB1-3]MCZ0976529.1 acyl-CoA thioester hydrolase [Lentilactobacillus sp. SPB1-3]